MRTLTIIILNYNTKELTLRAVQSCLDLTYKDLEIVVVDNASTDGSVEALKAQESRHANVQCIALDENNGFAAGNNAALKMVSSKYVMLLNSDAYFPKGEDLEAAIDFLDQYKDVGMLSPFVRLNDGAIDPACHRGFPTPWNAGMYFLGFEKLGILKSFFGGYHQTWKDHSVVHDIDACTGAAMIIRRSALEEVGLMDEQFFMYGEDLDWCFRFKELDWRIIFFPPLCVIHDKHSSGIKKKHGKSQNAFYDAMKIFYTKHNLGPSWMEKIVLLGIRLLSIIR